MAYYDALIAKWATLTPGTTAQKLTEINAITVTGSIPTVFFIEGSDLLNCLDWTEFAALTTAQQNLILSVCSIPGSIKGGQNSFVGKLFVATFTNLGGPTITNLTALAKAITLPWWQTAGYPVPIAISDCTAAGLS